MSSMRSLINAVLTEGYDMTPDEQQRFLAFVHDLEQISAKHGVILQVTGGVYVQDAPLDAVRYTKDWSSGDLAPVEYKRQDMGAPRRWGYEEDADDIRRQEEKEARKARRR